MEIESIANGLAYIDGKRLHYSHYENWLDDDITSHLFDIPLENGLVIVLALHPDSPINDMLWAGIAAKQFSHYDCGATITCDGARLARGSVLGLAIAQITAEDERLVLAITHSSTCIVPKSIEHVLEIISDWGSLKVHGLHELNRLHEREDLWQLRTG